MTFDNQVTGSFSDVRKLYDAEKENLLKTSPLTDAAVRPSKLQLQNVQHVLKVFSDKVEAALRLQKCGDTADIIQFVLNWWNVVNVSSKHQEAKLNDPHRNSPPPHFRTSPPPTCPTITRSSREPLLGTEKAESTVSPMTPRKPLCRPCKAWLHLCAPPDPGWLPVCTPSGAAE